ncbi:N-acetyl-D-Glu racemase DgcA [Neorhizobium sp. NPDC001467]|uniref:N-acetyl-D-Glu racemase DgcA n=1 Tax=Neorhizobium sp. NPDC001467 TaxID=3390595 RepID=UPI003CFE2313
MRRHLEATTESFPIAGSFTISRGSKTEAEVVTCTIGENGFTGRGECVPYRRYGETIDGVFEAIRAMAPAIEQGMDRLSLRREMKSGAARNAIDCALFDLEAKSGGARVATLLGMADPAPVVTCYTISLADPATMATQVAANAHRPLLKIKLGTENDADRIRAVRAAAPNARIVVDANEGWTPANIEHHLAVAAQANIELIEQPLPVGKDSILNGISRKVSICADESVHSTDDLLALRDRYDAVNIKLDKSGGLTEGLLMKAEAKRLGFKIMVGCMVGTSLAMAPAVLLAQGCDYADLDGPLLLARDRVPGLRYDGSLVSAPQPELWG